MATILGVEAAECAYIGDSGVDMEFGRAAGMLAIGVRWGFRTEEELVAAGAQKLVSSPEEILELAP
jgi:phosphoglycolate phosphatase